MHMFWEKKLGQDYQLKIFQNGTETHTLDLYGGPNLIQGWLLTMIQLWFCSKLPEMT